MELLWLDPRNLVPDPEGVREDLGDVSGLAATIAEQGLLQPLGVVPISGGRYQVVYGNRRRAAAIELGLERVPCILLDRDDPQLLLQQLTENLQRQDLNDMEKAAAFARLRDRLAGRATPPPAEQELDEAVGQAVGLTGRTVRRYLGLLELPHDVQALIRQGDLTVTQAQHLRRISNPRTQLELARAAVDEGMSAAELGRLAGYFAANPGMTLETALQALEQGLELRSERVGQPEQSGSGGPLPRGGATSLEVAESDADLWPEDSITTAEQLGLEETIENQPRNKARVFRIRSLDQMLDETDRLARVYVEGDLVKWVQHDEGAPFKVRLLLKQLNQLMRALRSIASERGWQEDADEE